MLNKFIASTIIPTTQTTMDAWEGEGNRIQAVIEGDIPTYVELKKIKEGKSFDLTVPLELAMREEGPCYIVHSNIKVAEMICEELHEELATDVSYLVEQYIEDGQIGIALASDVLAHVAKEATRVTNLTVDEAAITTLEGESVMAEQELVAMMKASGLEVGMTLHLGTVAASILRFVPTASGVSVVLKAGSKETTVPASDVIAVIQSNTQKEESTMTQGTTLTIKEATTTTTNTKGDITMTTTTNEVSNEQVIAASEAAQAFLNNTTPVAQTPVVEAPVVQAPVNAGVTIQLASQQATQTTTNTKEEVTMTTQPTVAIQTQTVVAPTTVVVPTSTPVVAGGPSVRVMGGAGTVSGPVTPGAIQPSSMLTEATKRYMSSPEASQTLGTSLRVPMKPWYLEDSLQGVIKGTEIDNNIVEVTLPNGAKEIRLRNKDLGIDLVALNIADMFAAGKMKFLPQDYQLIVELKMANDSVVIPFQIGIYGPGYNRYNNDVAFGRKVKATPIFANNIKRNEFKGKWSSELMLSTKNEKQHIVKCSCGSKNTFFPESFKQVKQGDKVMQTVGTQICWNDKCKKELVVAEVAQDASGNALEMTTMGYTQRRLPFGFQFGEEVLAQVMAFAHVVLEDSFTLGK